MNYCVIDFETTKHPNIHPWMPLAIPLHLGCLPVVGEYRHFRIQSEEWSTQETQNYLAQYQLIVGHHLKFEQNWRKKLGINTPAKLFCTQIAEYLLNGQEKLPLDLTSVALRYGVPPKIDMVKEFWDAGYDTVDIPEHILLPYLEQDCRTTEQVFLLQYDALRKRGLLPLFWLTTEFMDVLSDMETNGVKFNHELAERYAQEYEKRIEALDAEFFDLVGCVINLNSSQQLSAALYGGSYKEDGVYHYEVTLKSGEVKQKSRKCKVDKVLNGIGLKPLKNTETDAGGWSTDKNALSMLKATNKKQKRVLELLLERSNLEKAVSTYFIGYAEKTFNGFIHPSFNQTVTATGRLSSTNPNGQNIPRSGTSPVKQIFIPRFDLLGNADLSQLEWRVAAFLSQDSTMIQEILDGTDIHTENAIKYFGSIDYRTVAKILAFRLLYGGSAYAFFMDPKMPSFSLDKWEKLVEQFYKKYSGLAAQQERWVAEVRETGQIVSPSGRILKVQKQMLKGGYLGYKKPACVNYPVQSFATADITPLAIVVINKRMRAANLRSKLVLQVHDSLVTDMPKEELDEVAHIQLGVFNELPTLIHKMWGVNFNVPLAGEFEYGTDYGDMTKYKIGG